MKRLGPAAGCLLLALLVTASVWTDPSGRLLGHPDVDVWNHAWGPWWWADSLGQGRLPWRTELLRWPVGGVLWFIDPALALVGAPLVALLGLPLAFNLVLLLSVALTAGAARLLAMRLGADARSAWVAAAAAAGGAWVVCALHNGITEALHLAPLALALAETERALVQPGRRSGLRLGAALGVTAALSPYAGLATGMVIAVRVLLSGRAAPSWVVSTGLPAALLTALLAAGPTALLLANAHGPDALIRRSGELNESLALHNAVDPRTFVAPFGFRSVDLSAEGFEHSGYLGLVVLGLVAVALWRQPRLWRPALAAVASLVLALGSRLYWGDGWVEFLGAPLPLPWAGVQALLPGLAITHPLRMAMPAVVLSAALAAVALRGRGRLVVALAVAAVLADGLWLSGAPWPVATADAAMPAGHADLRRPADRPVGEAILDLPTDVGATMATSRYLYWQTGHRRPIPYIPDARATTASLVSLPDFRMLAALCSRRPEEHAAEGFDSALRGPLNGQNLLHQGFRWVVLHPSLDPDAAARLEPRLRWYLGEPEQRGDALRWDLGRPPPRRAGPPPWQEAEERRRRQEALDGG